MCIKRSSVYKQVIILLICNLYCYVCRQCHTHETTHQSPHPLMIISMYVQLILRDIKLMFLFILRLLRPLRTLRPLATRLRKRIFIDFVNRIFICIMEYLLC